jgi:molecular chaperone GrpE
MGRSGREPRDTHAAAADEASPAAAARGEDADVETEAAEESAAAAESAVEAAARATELEERWRRTLADLDNMRKRYAREIEAERAAERSRVVGAWLPVVDNLERALAHTDDRVDALVAGVRAVRDQAVALLAELGYPRDDETGVRFDPVRHEAVLVAPIPDAEPGTVMDVLRPGYGRGPLQLRPAAVVVAGPAE